MPQSTQATCTDVLGTAILVACIRASIRAHGVDGVKSGLLLIYCVIVFSPQHAYPRRIEIRQLALQYTAL